MTTSRVPDVAGRDITVEKPEWASKIHVDPRAWSVDEFNVKQDETGRPLTHGAYAHQGYQVSVAGDGSVLIEGKDLPPAWMNTGDVWVPEGHTGSGSVWQREDGTLYWEAGPLHNTDWVDPRQPESHLPQGYVNAMAPDSGNPKDAIGDTKPPLHLVPSALTIEAAMAMKNGAEKYGPYNWREHPVRATVYISAALRHITAYLDGEDNASDSGRPHLGHAVAGLGILLDAIATGNVIDDRPIAGAAASLIEANTERAA